MALLLSSPVANAQVTLTLAGGSSGDTLLLSNTPLGTVRGTVNGQDGFFITASSLSDDLTTGSSGQASVFSADGSRISDLTLATDPGDSFAQLIGNLGIGNQNEGASGLIDITVVSSSGTQTFTQTFTDVFAGDLKSGSNFFTLTGDTANATRITSVTLTSTGTQTFSGFDNLGQLRVTGAFAIESVSAPEPGSIALFGIGFAGMAGMIARRKHSAR
jgi:hypothetical protein